MKSLKDLRQRIKKERDPESIRALARALQRRGDYAGMMDLGADVGFSLQQIMRAKVPEETLKDAFNLIVDALTTLHQQGAVHGMLNADNIYFWGTKRGILSVSLSASPNTDQLHLLTLGPPLPQSSVPLKRSEDIFGLGVLLYLRCEGALPFLPSKKQHLSHNVALISPPQRRLPTQTGRATSAHLTLALHPDPRRRHASAAALLGAFDHSRMGDGIMGGGLFGDAWFGDGEPSGNSGNSNGAY